MTESHYFVSYYIHAGADSGSESLADWVKVIPSWIDVMISVDVR